MQVDALNRCLPAPRNDKVYAAPINAINWTRCNRLYVAYLFGRSFILPLQSIYNSFLDRLAAGQWSVLNLLALLRPSIVLVIGFKLVAGAIASNAFTGVAIGVGLIFASLVSSISRNPSQRDEVLRFSFIGFSLVEASGLIGLVMSFVLLFGFWAQ